MPRNMATLNPAPQTNFYNNNLNEAAQTPYLDPKNNVTMVP